MVIVKSNGFAPLHFQDCENFPNSKMCFAPTNSGNTNHSMETLINHETNYANVSQFNQTVNENILTILNDFALQITHTQTRIEVGYIFYKLGGKCIPHLYWAHTHT